MKSLSHLNKYFYRYRFRLLLGVAFVAISNLFAIYPAQVVRYAVDYIRDAQTVYFAFGHSGFREDIYMSYLKTFALFAFVILALALLKGLFMFFMRQTIIVVSRYIEYDLKNEVYHHYQQLDLSFYRRNNTGDLMARISEDVSRVRMYVGPAIMYTINLVVMLVLVIAAMFSVNARLAFYVLLPLPILSFSVYYVSNLINKKSEQVQTQLSGLSTYVQEAFSGIRVLKAFVREQSSANDFTIRSAAYAEKSMALAKVNSFFPPIMLALIGLSTLVTVYVGGKEAMAGTITFGNIAEFIIYVNMLTWPVASLGWVTSLIQRAAASQQRINEFLHTQPTIISGSEMPAPGGQIAFRNIGFVYPDSGIRALKDVSFVVESGQSLAILGKTGSGKSTVANLLVRLYDPTEGCIFYDGKDIRQFDLHTYRSLIGYVPQDVFLFSDTIYNNIALGQTRDKKHSENEVIQAAKDAAVYDNIMHFPQQFDTMLGERGITLSGGQKQRISIARAIVRSPQILFFDDCLSAVDTRTEEEILKNLQKVMKGKTTLIVSHRVSTVKLADRILMLEHGVIAEQGTHTELLARKGAYFELHEKQMLEEIQPTS